MEICKIEIYKIEIYERYRDLINSGKKAENLDNNDLWKIFEYYSCIKLSNDYNKNFYEYNDIDPSFKEINKLSRIDTGIDCCDLDNTIVQCKLRKGNLNWKECSTFFGSQNIFCDEQNKTIIRWNNLIITRNDDCILSENLTCKTKMFIDKKYKRDEIINYCEELIINPPKYSFIKKENFELRDYQKECINLIKEKKNNIIISLPTGTGKNIILIHSLNNDLKYLILVPRIFLMEQLENEIIKHKPEMKYKIQLIGDNNNKFSKNKNITICVFNSISKINTDFSKFEKIFVDEAHHINIPEIYESDNDNINNNDIDSDNESESESESESDSNSEGNNEWDSNNESDNIDKNTYIKKIKELTKFNNNVYLSATIDKIKKFEYYKKDIRQMIEQKYLSDYTVNIPIFSDKATNKIVCEYLIKNYKNIIIYCDSRQKGKEINNILNYLLNGSSEYIDCNTSKKSREIIIDKYKKGLLSFLVNVRILVEGFDAPITKGVCFMHLPNSNNTLIQIIGRSLRLHPQKTIANVILPFSTKEYETSINKFMRIIARNDNRIKKSYENKKIGGYISIDNNEIENNIEDNNYNNIEFKYNYIYNSMGILKNGKDIWLQKKEELKIYIDTYKTKPSSINKDEKIKQLGIWCNNQQIKYKNNEQIMQDSEIRKLWEEFLLEYKKYFESFEEVWNNTLNKVIEYIDKYKKRPYIYDKTKDEKYLGKWIGSQMQNFNKQKKLMARPEIRKTWINFTSKYKEYFKSAKEIWHGHLFEVKKYIDSNNKKPSTTDKNIETRSLGYWISEQISYYKNGLMKQTEIKDEWIKFISEYKEYFKSNEEIWFEKLDEVKSYINKYNKKPSQYDKNKTIQTLRIWINCQQSRYKNNEGIMRKLEIRNKWLNFIEEYKTYFI
jgi:superfamily II DNA or RNA helicase